MRRRLKGEADLRTMTCTEKVKFYMSLCFGTTAVLSFFAFLFLIPFMVDPCITTILARFDPEPVVCLTVKHVYAEGISNCTWTSCKEGCTSITPRCHQIYVNYSSMYFQHWEKHKIALDLIEWKESEVKFYINTEGCGYPPKVNCAEFVRRYGWYDRKPNVFPCYYSREHPKLRAVANYSWRETIKNLLLSIGLPNLLFGISVFILTYWYCWPTPQDRRRKILDPTCVVNNFSSTIKRDKGYYGFEEDETTDICDSELDTDPITEDSINTKPFDYNILKQKAK